ncbi:fructose-bisphosphatase class II [Rathayibacter sp. YIM 133350]|uniref:fructose-bisphosphatase class II n=1 Tax=Rathayibacter sp. YIM 133350 TaxID=3131992 RepID=UPI00307CEF72
MNPSAGGIRGALVHAAQVAARATLPFVGGGDAMAVDAAAVAALRTELERVPVDGRVVVGEGEKDEAPMLFVGERFGSGGPSVDLAVDPIDGTRLAAEGAPGAMVVMALAPRGGLIDLGPAHYMQKLVVSGAHPNLRVDDEVAAVLAELARGSDDDGPPLRVLVQERPRNAALIEQLEAASATVERFRHGDIERSVRVLRGGADALLGTGGAPEAVITAALARALGGTMSARFAPQGAREAQRLAAAGGDPYVIRGAGDVCRADALVVIASVTGVDLGAGLTLPPVGADGTVAVWTAGSIG